MTARSSFTLVDLRSNRSIVECEMVDQWRLICDVVEANNPRRLGHGALRYERVKITESDTVS